MNILITLYFDIVIVKSIYNNKSRYSKFYLYRIIRFVNIIYKIKLYFVECRSYKQY